MRHRDAVTEAKAIRPGLGTVYQIYLRFFADGNGDGIGDFIGATNKVDYIAGLGVDSVWLTPFYPSPMADGGYDISEHCDVHPSFGTLDAFDEFVGNLHQRGMRVIVDFVPNHTSDEHKWFQASSDPAHPDHDRYRDYYIWVDPAPVDENGVAFDDSVPVSRRFPNNWKRAFAPMGSLDLPVSEFSTTWTFCEARQQFYLHKFLSKQPDLNWDSIDLRSDMASVVIFWMNHGVDGFRIDVSHCPSGSSMFEGVRPMDEPPWRNRKARADTHFDPERSNRYLAGIVNVARVLGGDKVIFVGETNVMGYNETATEWRYAPHLVRRLVGRIQDDMIPSGFEFRLTDLSWGPDVKQALNEWLSESGDHYGSDQVSPIDSGPVPSVASGCHDKSRAATTKGSRTRAAAALGFLFGVRSSPYLYQTSDDLGLPDVDVPAEHCIDPGGRDKNRTPMPWDKSVRFGWDGERPVLPFGEHAEELSVETQDRDSRSFLNMVRALNEVRKDSPALVLGSQRIMTFDEAPVVGIARSWRNVSDDFDDRMIMTNLGLETERVDEGAGMVVALSTADFGPRHGHRGRLEGGRLFTGDISGETTVILRPIYDEVELTSLVDDALTAECDRALPSKSGDMIPTAAIVQAHLHSHVRNSEPVALQAASEKSTVAAVLLAEVHFRRGDLAAGVQAVAWLAEEDRLSQLSLSEETYLRSSITYLSNVLRSITEAQALDWKADMTAGTAASRISSALKLANSLRVRIDFDIAALSSLRSALEQGAPEAVVTFMARTHAVLSSNRANLDHRDAFPVPGKVEESTSAKRNWVEELLRDHAERGWISSPVLTPETA